MEQYQRKTDNLYKFPIIIKIFKGTIEVFMTLQPLTNDASFRGSIEFAGKIRANVTKRRNTTKLYLIFESCKIATRKRGERKEVE